MAQMTALVARLKKAGSISASDLLTELEKMDLTVEQIEQFYEQCDSLGIQIISAELELDIDDATDVDIKELEEEEELVDPV